jgi:hypothetical protein
MHGGMSSVWGQTSPAADSIPAAHDSVPTAVPLLADTLAVTAKDSVPPVITETSPTPGDSLPPAGTLTDTTATALDSTAIGLKSDSLLRHTPSFMEKRFIPNPQRALWLSLIIPGAGQIYNRKLWKIPIVYGGFLGCLYALTWNNQMYGDYSQAYLDIMDDDPNTKSYENMLPLNYSIAGREDQYKEIFKNKKNYYRKYRDMSIFAMIAVYLLSVVDAYVDAELSSFDISKDLGLRIEPAVFNFGGRGREASVGVQCNLNF